MLESLLEPQSGGSGDDVDTPRGNSDLKDGVVFLQITERQSMQGGAKALHSAKDGYRIVW